MSDNKQQNTPCEQITQEKNQQDNKIQISHDSTLLKATEAQKEPELKFESPKLEDKPIHGNDPTLSQINTVNTQDSSVGCIKQTGKSLQQVQRDQQSSQAQQFNPTTVADHSDNKDKKDIQKQQSQTQEQKQKNMGLLEQFSHVNLQAERDNCSIIENQCQNIQGISNKNKAQQLTQKHQAQRQQQIFKSFGQMDEPLSSQANIINIEGADHEESEILNQMLPVFEYENCSASNISNSDNEQNHSDGFLQYISQSSKQFKPRRPRDEYMRRSMRVMRGVPLAAMRGEDQQDHQYFNNNEYMMDLDYESPNEQDGGLLAHHKQNRYYKQQQYNQMLHGRQSPLKNRINNCQPSVHRRFIHDNNRQSIGYNPNHYNMGNNQNFINNNNYQRQPLQSNYKSNIIREITPPGIRQQQQSTQPNFQIQPTVNPIPLQFQNNSTPQFSQNTTSHQQSQKHTQQQQLNNQNQMTVNKQNNLEQQSQLQQSQSQFSRQNTNISTNNLNQRNSSNNIINNINNNAHSQLPSLNQALKSINDSNISGTQQQQQKQQQQQEKDLQIHLQQLELQQEAPGFMDRQASLEGFFDNQIYQPDPQFLQQQQLDNDIHMSDNDLDDDQQQIDNKFVNKNNYKQNNYNQINSQINNRRNSDNNLFKPSLKSKKIQKQSFKSIRKQNTENDKQSSDYSVEPVRRRNNNTNNSSQRQQNRPPRTYPCEDCGRIFNERGNLKVHSRIHSKIRPHICDFPGCGETFTTIGNRNDHRRRHTHFKPYKCSCNIGVCVTEYYRLYQLKRHIVSKHGTYIPVEDLNIQVGTACGHVNSSPNNNQQAHNESSISYEGSNSQHPMQQNQQQFNKQPETKKSDLPDYLKKMNHQQTKKLMQLINNIECQIREQKRLDMSQQQINSNNNKNYIQYCKKQAQIKYSNYLIPELKAILEDIDDIDHDQNEEQIVDRSTATGNGNGNGNGNGQFNHIAMQQQQQSYQQSISAGYMEAPIKEKMELRKMQDMINRSQSNNNNPYSNPNNTNTIIQQQNKQSLIKYNTPQQPAFNNYNNFKLTTNLPELIKSTRSVSNQVIQNNNNIQGSNIQTNNNNNFGPTMSELSQLSEDSILQEARPTSSKIRPNKIDHSINHDIDMQMIDDQQQQLSNPVGNSQKTTAEQSAAKQQ